MKIYAGFILAISLVIISCKKEKEPQQMVTFSKKSVLQFKDLVSGQPLPGILIRRGRISSDVFQKADSLITDQNGKISYERFDFRNDVFEVASPEYFSHLFEVTGDNNGDLLNNLTDGRYKIADALGVSIPPGTVYDSDDSSYFEVKLLKKVPVKIKIKQETIFPSNGYLCVITCWVNDAQSVQVLNKGLLYEGLFTSTLFEKEINVLLAGDITNLITVAIYKPDYSDDLALFKEIEMNISAGSPDEIDLTF